MEKKCKTCGECYKYPFCEYTTKANQEACCNSIKRNINDNYIERKEKKKKNG